MTEVTTDFAISYLLDDCQDCPENKDGECMTQSHCFEVKQMAIKALKQNESAEEWYKLFVEKLEQEPRWIPVSEKLPDKNVWVLVTVEQNGNRYQEIMRRNMYREAWTDEVDLYTDEITAWMPLPKPYEPQESEDKE